MFIYLLIYYLLFLIILWANVWYILYLYFYRIFIGEKKAKEPDFKDEDLPTVAIIIPCYNDRNFIKKKIEQLVKINYPKDKLNVYFLDGESSDHSDKLIEECAKDEPFIHLVRTGVRGKIYQINSYLPQIKEDIIINNDIDTIIDHECVIKTVRLLRDNDIGVVGGYVEPYEPIEFESKYWQAQNEMRILETIYYSSSIVIAPFYAFRRKDFAAFPEDCIADDIYMSFYMCSKGKRSYYARDIKVFELRNPKDYISLFRHKFRKSNAYIREIFRFLYLLPYYNIKWKIIFVTRWIQMFFLPWLFLLFFLFSVSLLLIDFNYVKVVSFIGIIYILSIFGAHFATKPAGENILSFKGSRLLIIKVFVLTLFLLLVSGVSYPFYKQTSEYKKIKQENDEN